MIHRPRKRRFDSGEVKICVTTEAWLLLRLLSSWSPLTVASFVRLVAAPGFTVVTIVTVALAFSAKVPGVLSWCRWS